MSGNLGIVQITAAQNQKEVTANAALLRLDAAITELLSVSVAAGNATLTAAQFQTAVAFLITGATVAGRTVTVPAIRRLFLVRADAANTESVAVVRGSTSISVAPGQATVCYTDATASGLFAVSSTSLAWASITGTPTTLAGYGISDGVPNARNINSGDGLTGGGDLTADRTLALTGVALALHSNTEGAGTAPLRVPRNADLGDAAFTAANALRGRFPIAAGAAYQITADDWGRTLIAESGTLTWTLPVITELVDGWWVQAWNRSGNTLTIQRAASALIGAGATSITVADGAGVTLARRDNARFERIA